RPRLHASARDDRLRRPRVLLQLLLAAQDRVPLPVVHPPAALPHPRLQLPRLARGLPDPRLLPGEALLLLLDLRLRRARPPPPRGVPASLLEVPPGLAGRGRVGLPPPLSLLSGPP